MKKLKKIWDIISLTIVILMVLCAIFLMGSRLLGYRVFNIISGSMEPVYSVGDLIYVKEVAPEDIKVGDDITFVLNEDLVIATHRVVRIDPEKKHFYTKGVANDTEDAAPVQFNNLVGVPQFSLPMLGYVSEFIQNPPGMYIVLILGAAMLIIVFLPDLMPKKKAAPTPEETEQEAAAKEENARLRAELEALKAQLEQKEPEQPEQTSAEET